MVYRHEVTAVDIGDLKRYTAQRASTLTGKANVLWLRYLPKCSVTRAPEVYAKLPPKRGCLGLGETHPREFACPLQMCHSGMRGGQPDSHAWRTPLRAWLANAWVSMSQVNSTQQRPLRVLFPIWNIAQQYCHM